MLGKVGGTNGCLDSISYGKYVVDDFENEEDYEKAAAEYEHGKKKALYAFMAEDGGLNRFPLGLYT